MLVITRRPGEAILIGDEIELQVIDVSPSRVKLGITAPRKLTILRKEIRLAADENRAASRSFGTGQFQGLLERLRAAAPRDKA
jgi:carbon storage regulator